MKEVIINEKVYPIHFGLRSLSEFSKDGGLDFAEVISGNDVSGSLEVIGRVVKLAVFGLNEAAKIEKQTERYTEDDVWYMLDCDPSAFTRIMEVFNESITPLVDKLGSMGKS